MQPTTLQPNADLVAYDALYWLASEATAVSVLASMYSSRRSSCESSPRSSVGDLDLPGQDGPSTASSSTSAPRHTRTRSRAHAPTPERATSADTEENDEEESGRCRKRPRRACTVRKSKGTRGFVCSDAGCRQKFATKYDCLRHERIHLPKDKKPFQCTACDHAAVQESNFKAHVRRHHPELADC